MIPANYSPEGAEGLEKKGEIVDVTLGDLLPMSFGPEDLDRPKLPHGS
jgi:cytidine deaminase